MSAIQGAAQRIRAAEASAGEPRVLNVAAIFAPLPPVRWLCQLLDLAPGAPALLAGYGYSGKTVAAQDLALAVASGTLAWGRFPMRAGRVLHLDYEQGSYLTRARYQRLARARALDPAELEGRLELRPLPEWYLDNDAADELPRICDGFDLVIVDSFRAACPLTDENASEARVALDRLGRVSEKTGALALVLHHARKPTQGAQGGARMSVRGSGALYDACGSVLVFSGEKGDPVTVAHEKARISGRTHPDFQLWIEDVQVDGDPVAGLRVSCLDAPTSAAKQTPADRFTGLKARVLELVREASTIPGGVNTIRARVGGRKDDVCAAVAELEAVGVIRRGGTATKPTYFYAGTTEDSE